MVLSLFQEQGDHEDLEEEEEEAEADNEEVGRGEVENVATPHPPKYDDDTQRLIDGELLVYLKSGQT